MNETAVVYVCLGMLWTSMCMVFVTCVLAEIIVRQEKKNKT